MGTLRCVNCLLFFVSTVLLADVHSVEQGKIFLSWGLQFHAILLLMERSDTEICFWFLTGTDELRLLAITVATDETDGYKRFMRSAKVNNIDVKVFLNYSCVFPFCGLLGERHHNQVNQIPSFLPTALKMFVRSWHLCYCFDNINPWLVGIYNFHFSNGIWYRALWIVFYFFDLLWSLYFKTNSWQCINLQRANFTRVIVMLQQRRCKYSFDSLKQRVI